MKKKRILCVNETLLFNGENTVQAQPCLKKYYFDSVPLKTMICKWYDDFKCGYTDTNDVVHLGRLNETVTLKNTKQVLKNVIDDHKLKVCEVAKIVNISTGNASTILHEKLGYGKSLFQMGAAFSHNGVKATTN